MSRALLVAFACFGSVGCWITHGAADESGPAPDPQSEGQRDGCFCEEEATPGCFEADDACPASAPYPGSPCLGTLTCPDIDGCGFGCVDGRWVGTATCARSVEVERCDDPGLDVTDEAGVEVQLGWTGLDGDFEPFGDESDVPYQVGPDDQYVLFVRARVDGVRGDCVTMHLRFADALGRVTEVVEPVRLHCGATLGMYVVLPAPPGDVAAPWIDASIEIAGLGADQTRLHLVTLPEDPEG